MARIRLALLCETVIIGQDTNQISYINLVNDIAFPNLPAQLFPFITASSIWERERGSDEETIRLRLRLEDPDHNRKVLLEPEPMTVREGTHRVNVRLAGIKVERPGLYHFLWDLKRPSRWATQARVPLMIRVAEPEEDPD